MKKLNLPLFSYVIKSIILIILNLIGLIFALLFIKTTTFDIIKNNSSVFQVILIAIMSSITVFSAISQNIKNVIYYKISLILSILIPFIFILGYVLNKSGFFILINSVDDLRNFISGFGIYADLIFVLIQFLQVAILPIPGVLTVGAGVLLFGPLKATILSSIGIILGSIVAFFIGRIFGHKVVSWLVGKDNLNNTINKVKGKDKVLLFTMFLLPFFPDDILCFVAGLTSINFRFFFYTTLITRLISTSVASFSLNNNFIPYNTWWGIVLWIIIFISTLIFVHLIFKHGEKIETHIKKLFKKHKNKKKTSNNL
jgi:uncharacterized membrane protein YdjX (TVP38/TMEM64 family)